MLLSKGCEYGIRAAVYLAGRPGERVPIRAISDSLGIPYPFLAKISQTLTAAGILISARGPNGGVRLARPPSRVTIEEVVLALDGADLFTECVLGLPGCGDRRPCPLHDAWVDARERVRQMFREASLATIAERVAAGEFRLAAEGRAMARLGAMS